MFSAGLSTLNNLIKKGPPSNTQPLACPLTPDAVKSTTGMSRFGGKGKMVEIAVAASLLYDPVVRLPLRKPLGCSY